MQLLRRADDVSVVLGKLPDPQKSVQNARFLMAMYGTQFEETQGKVAVAPQFRLVDDHVGQAVHGLDPV